jgi:hypothetical protein
MLAAVLVEAGRCILSRGNENMIERLVQECVMYFADVQYAGSRR